MIYRPNGHEEIHVKKGSVVLKKYEDITKCGKGEFRVHALCENITFNDKYISFTERHFPETNRTEGHCICLDGAMEGWFVEVVVSDNVKEEPEEPKEQQISIFDLLGD